MSEAIGPLRADSSTPAIVSATSGECQRVAVSFTSRNVEPMSRRTGQPETAQASRQTNAEETHMTGWINGTLDELDAGVRAHKRELARREQEISWYQDQTTRSEDRDVGRVHDLEALRRQLSRRAESEPLRDAHRARRVSLSHGVA
jgi:hypothetical protein